jgi:hypothetical protein
MLALLQLPYGGAVAQLGARLDGIEEVVGSNPIGSTIPHANSQNRLKSDFLPRLALFCLEARGKVWRHDQSSKMVGQWQN